MNFNLLFVDATGINSFVQKQAALLDQLDLVFQFYLNLSCEQFRLNLHGLLANKHDECDCGSFANLTLQVDYTAARLNESLGSRHTQADTFTAGWNSRATFFDQVLLHLIDVALERHECIFNLSLGHSTARVLYLCYQVAPLLLLVHKQLLTESLTS